MSEKNRALRLIVAILTNPKVLIRVSDEEATSVKPTRDVDAIMAELNATGYDVIEIVKPEFVKNPDPNQDNFVRSGKFCRYGSFELIWGNDPDGSELISDHTDNAYCCKLEVASR